MDNKQNIIKSFRKLQTFISILLFFIIFFFCWTVTGFNLTEIQLSKWGGEHNNTGLLWNTIVCLLSISIFVNSALYIKHDHRMQHKSISYFLFFLVSLSLFLVGVFNVNYYFIHELAAYFYFFSYPLVIFFVNYINRKNIHYKSWITQLIISIVMAIVPLVFISLFNGKAIAETVHICIVVIWNLYIAFKSN